MTAHNAISSKLFIFLQFYNYYIAKHLSAINAGFCFTVNFDNLKVYKRLWQK